MPRSKDLTDEVADLGMKIGDLFEDARCSEELAVSTLASVIAYLAKDYPAELKLNLLAAIAEMMGFNPLVVRDKYDA